MTATELKPCPFCGGEATAVPDANHATGWEVGCFSRFCAVEPHVWAVHKSTAQMQWNERVDINQAGCVQDKWEEIDSTMTRIVEAERDAAIARAEKAVARSVFTRFSIWPRRKSITPQEIFDYKTKWLKTAHIVKVNSDLGIECKHWCTQNLKRQEWSFSSYTDVYEHTFYFENEESAKQFESWLDVKL